MRCLHDYSFLFASCVNIVMCVLFVVLGVCICLLFVFVVLLFVSCVVWFGVFCGVVASCLFVDCCVLFLFVLCSFDVSC